MLKHEKKMFILNKKRDIEQEFDLVLIAQNIYICFYYIFKLIFD